MTDPSIRSLLIRNYGPVRDATVRLTPLHALIGPNDSGKSSILRALGTITHVATETASTLPPSFRSFLETAKELELTVNFHDSPGYRISSPEPSGDPAPVIREAVIDGEREIWSEARTNGQKSFLIGKSSSAPPSNREILERLSGMRLVRFDPDALRRPSGLIPDDRAPFFEDDRGAGLPGVLDAIVNRDVEVFLELQTELRRLFPSVRRLSLRNTSLQQKAIEVQLDSGERISAEAMSEGMLLYLAYASIPHVSPTSVLLVEEPENGLHPARIADVVRILRAVAQKTQVVIATHSPLVINELEPAEVSVVTRTPEKGTLVTPIAKTPRFADRAKVYALGELWLSYADGTFERPLLGASPEAG